MVVDVDLEKFFDRVNHDILMDRLAKRIADKTVLRLIRSYLQAGIMANGVVMDRSGERRKAGLSPLWPTCCWMKWIRTCKGVGIALHVMQMTATFTFAVRRLTSRYCSR